MRRYISAVLGLLAVAGLSAGVASAATASAAVPAQAGQGRAYCPADTYCLYEHRGFNKRDSKGKVLIPRGSVDNLGNDGWDNRASSVVNNMNQPIYLYRDFTSWTDPGTCLEVRPGQAYYDLGLFTLDNQVTSISLESCY